TGRLDPLLGGRALLLHALEGMTRQRDGCRARGFDDGLPAPVAVRGAWGWREWLMNALPAGLWLLAVLQ
nr:hypothetical protein [Magnetococcales bacterium]